MRDLVQRAMAHDHEAFSELARLVAGKLYAVARLILRDTDTAEDATQETLVAAWRDIASLRDPDRFEAWIRRILVRECYRAARDARKRRNIEVRVEPIEVPVQDSSIDIAERDALDRAFRRLQPDQRALIALYYQVGLPMQETADALGLPIGTVKSRLHRTTQTLRAALDADARNGRTPRRSA